MDEKEVKEIIEHIRESPVIFNAAIKLYHDMPAGKDRRDLGEAIRAAKEAFTKLDVTLEDIQLDLEYEQMKAAGLSHY